MARSTMAALILRVRDLINDTLPIGSGQVWTDNQIQDVLDESRSDVINGNLVTKPTFSGSTIQYLDYFSDGGSWEDGMVIKQYLTVLVTPATIEPIVGHFVFASNVFPPCFITGKNYDIYRAAADLLERWAAKVVLEYDVVVGGQTFRRSQAAPMLQALAKRYRMKQRAKTINLVRSDVASTSQTDVSLAPTELDYMSSGSKQG
jgi:hypothetical protein